MGNLYFLFQILMHVMQPLELLRLHQQGLQNFGLSSILATYMRGLESEGVEWGAELRELRFQAAWRNTQWDCELSER